MPCAFTLTLSWLNVEQAGGGGVGLLVQGLGTKTSLPP